MLLYIHIPFCKSKCFYCDFTSYSDKCDFIDDYLQAVDKEIQTYQNSKISTIFIGGGTPSVLSIPQLEKLIHSIQNNFDLTDLKEFTIEANPESLSLEKINFLRKTGLVNRFSLGLQAFDDKILKRIGRLHTFLDFCKVYENLKNNGFTNINVDLIVSWNIFGNRNYDVNFLQDLDKFLQNFDLKHISIYMLTLPFGFTGCKIAQAGFKSDQTRFKIDQDLQVDTYLKAMQIIKAHGFEHYEISNFAKKGMQCKHNLGYWNREEYIGIGASACSFLGENRYKNADKLTEYFLGKKDTEILSKQDKLNEEIMLNLRLLNKGLDYDKKFKVWIQGGFLEKKGNKIVLTEKGITVCNQILVEIFEDCIV